MRRADSVSRGPPPSSGLVVGGSGWFAFGTSSWSYRDENKMFLHSKP